MESFFGDLLCRRKIIASLFTAGLLSIVSSSWSQEPRVELRYPHGPDSFKQDGVPEGKVTEYQWLDSKIYPGTVRRYYTFVPAQYDGSKPAALMVFQDGHAYIGENGDFRIPIVFDNLIHKGELPVIIGVFVDPGHKKSELPPERGWRPQPENRSVEYDSLGKDYSEFLLTEILPEVQKTLKITDDPEGRAICGTSSGGICSFTVAWERPDQFRKVLSTIGSFVNIRGGHVYPALIRKERNVKPVKIFLQDGSNDLDNQHGNWPLSNKQMYAALMFKKYDVKFVFGEGAHSGNHGGSIMPDALRWLWEGYKLPE